MAQFGWIDFSPKDRQRVGTILELMKPSGQVDELGIGTIRDGLTDRLFPGISTIQTRAKYFFIIPYILQDFLRLSASERSRKTPSKYLVPTIQVFNLKNYMNFYFLNKLISK